MNDKIYLTPADRATKLVNEWANEMFGKPFTVSLARLGIMVAEAIQEAQTATCQHILDAMPLRSNGDHLSDELFTLEEAIVIIGQTVRVATDRLDDCLPPGLRGYANAFRPVGANGYQIGVTWQDGNASILMFFSKVEFYAWLEEIELEEEAA